MCGLFGLASSTSLIYRQEQFLKQCSFVGTMRGVHSTGFALFDKENNMQEFKRALAGPDFNASAVGQNCFKALRDTFVAIGHNRAATRGKVNDSTAHPFTFGTITGAHNGTLANIGNGLKDNSLEVDSMNLLNALSQVGEAPSAKDYAKFLSDIDGSYALTWYDAATELLWLVRNDERPLSYFETDDGELFWASEAGMLGWIAQRTNNLKKVSAIQELPTLTVKGYDCRNMQFVDEATYEEPEKHWTGAYQGNLHNMDGSKKSSKNKPTTAYYSNDFEDRVENIAAGAAITSKKWNEDDNEVYVVLEEVEESINPEKKLPLKYDGYVYTTAGEKFSTRMYGFPSELTIGKVYIGTVTSLMVSATMQGLIYRVSVDKRSLVSASDSKKDNNKLLLQLEEECADMVEVEAEREVAETFDDVPDTKVAKLPSPSKGNNKSTFPDGLKGPFGTIIGQDDFDELTSDGCHHCAVSLNREDHKEIGWLNGKYPLCEDCIEIVGNLQEYYGMRESNVS